MSGPILGRNVMVLNIFRGLAWPNTQATAQIEWRQPLGPDDEENL